MTLKSSLLYTELHSLPLFKSVEGVYTRLKESSAVAAAGLAVLEYSCTGVLEKFYDGSSVAKGMDTLAGKGVAKLIDRYPSLSKSPEELEDSTRSVMKQAVRRVMKTPPGQMLIWGLDWAIVKTERVLRKVKPKRPRSPRKKMTRSAMQKQQLGADHAYALDDSGACDSDRAARPSPAAVPPAVNRLAESDTGLLRKVFNLMCVLPLEASVRLMKSVRRYTGGKRKSKHSLEQSPGDRRKVSPRKKMTSSLFRRLMTHTSAFLGYPGVGKRVRLDILVDSSPVKPEDDDDDKGDKKRKHDEIMTDTDSDSSQDDMNNFDFDAYDSEEDPDYQPTEEDTDSESSDVVSECDTESDVEAEAVISGPGPVHVQIKESKGSDKDQKDHKKIKDGQGPAEAPKKPSDLKQGPIDPKKISESVSPKGISHNGLPTEKTDPGDLNLRPNSKYAQGQQGQGQNKGQSHSKGQGFGSPV